MNNYSYIVRNLKQKLDVLVVGAGQSGLAMGRFLKSGLFFLGLPWQHCRNSALIGGVGSDARYLLHFIHKERRMR
jgi:ribulose 1,5-bisphosphate synthetase/thiazole synthase